MFLLILSILFFILGFNFYKKGKNLKSLKVEQENEKLSNLKLDEEKITQNIDFLNRQYSKVKDDYYKTATELEDSDLKLKKIKESLTAGVQAQLRERKEKDAINFYKIEVKDKDLSDIEKINLFKKELSQPIILNKLIWSTYFQKQTSDLCNRILGVNPKTGIYKITNLKTKQSYIGQSVNIADRWKQHIKCGLGIDASATNKLYNAMQEDGVWNFSFELIEECSKELLNEKERLWIQTYQSDKFGYNLTKGNK